MKIENVNTENGNYLLDRTEKDYGSLSIFLNLSTPIGENKILKRKIPGVFMLYKVSDWRKGNIYICLIFLDC